MAINKSDLYSSLWASCDELRGFKVYLSPMIDCSDGLVINDIQWTRIVELDLVPHPRLGRPEIIRMDYGMVDGSIRMRVRSGCGRWLHAASLERGRFAGSQPQRRTVPVMAQRSAGLVRCGKRKTGTRVSPSGSANKEMIGKTEHDGQDT
jgi:hypothetical protein